MARTAKVNSKRQTGTKAGREIIAALEEIQHAVTTRDFSKLTLREVEIPDPSSYGPKQVRALRESLAASQGIFALLIGVSPELVRHWEYGLRKPAPVVCRLLDQIKANPEGFMASLVRHRTLRTA